MTFRETMMPGQNPYTEGERAQRDALIADAAEGDPGEAGEGEVYRRKVRRLLDKADRLGEIMSGAAADLERVTEKGPRLLALTESDLDHIAARIAEELAAFVGGQFRPEYNGWRNRETWSAALWIGNDQPTYEAAREIVAAAVAGDAASFSRGSRTEKEERTYLRNVAGDALKDWYTARYEPTDTASPLSDAWTYALSWVDWRDVVDSVEEDILALIPGGGGYRR